MSRVQMVTHLEPLVTIVTEPFIMHVTNRIENQNLSNAKSAKQRSVLKKVDPLSLKYILQKNGGGRKAKTAAKLASKRQSDPDIDTSIRSRDRHGSESGGSTSAGERDRIGLNDSLRLVMFQTVQYKNYNFSKYYTPSPEGRRTRTAQGRTKSDKKKIVIIDPVERCYRPRVSEYDKASGLNSLCVGYFAQAFLNHKKRNFIVQLDVKPKVEWVI